MSALGRAASIFKSPCLHNTAQFSDTRSGIELIFNGDVAAENLAMDSNARKAGGK